MSQPGWIFKHLQLACIHATDGMVSWLRWKDNFWDFAGFGAWTSLLPYTDPSGSMMICFHVGSASEVVQFWKGQRFPFPRRGCSKYFLRNRNKFCWYTDFTEYEAELDKALWGNLILLFLIFCCAAVALEFQSCNCLSLG